MNEDLSNNVDTIISHNIGFDINILLSECYRLEHNELIDNIENRKKKCTMRLGKKYMNYHKSPKLIELYKHLFNKDIIQEHRALIDTEMCKDCYFGMKNN